MEDLLFEDYLDNSRLESLQRFELKFRDPIEIGIAEKFQFENLLEDYHRAKPLENTCYY